jgi:hypothetical protein
MRNAKKKLSENMSRRDNSDILGIDGRKILKLTVVE